MLLLVPRETFVEKQTNIKSRAPHISSSCPFFVVFIAFDGLFFSFRFVLLYTTMNNLNNKNNNQAIRASTTILLLP
jgi:hypothetical protein